MTLRVSVLIVCGWVLLCVGSGTLLSFVVESLPA